jgi:hypothetical protein
MAVVDWDAQTMQMSGCFLNGGNRWIEAGLRTASLTATRGSWPLACPHQKRYWRPRIDISSMKF